jgi:hypothetical protein
LHRGGFGQWHRIGAMPLDMFNAWRLQGKLHLSKRA